MGLKSMYINGQKLHIRKYSSGELKLVKSILDKYIIDNKVSILYTNEYSLFELLLIINYYKEKGITIDLTLTYLPYQRMDHEGRDELNTIKNVANIFNALQLNSITICEPHCDTKMFNNVTNISFIKLLKEIVFNEINFTEDDIIVLTDKGGYKRYSYMSKNLVYFNKVRDIETGLIIKHELIGNLDITKKIIIVDDIISTGDTIINIVDKLTEMGAKEIYILTGHIEKNKYNYRILNHKNIKKVFSTNSLRKRQTKKLKLYDTKELIWNALK